MGVFSARSEINRGDSRVFRRFSPPRRSAARPQLKGPITSRSLVCVSEYDRENSCKKKTFRKLSVTMAGYTFYISSILSSTEREERPGNRNPDALKVRALEGTINASGETSSALSDPSRDRLPGPGILPPASFFSRDVGTN